MDYEPGLWDLVRAIDLTLIALVEPEADARIVQVALENAQRIAADLNKKWYADCERLIEKVEEPSPRRAAGHLCLIWCQREGRLLVASKVYVHDYRSLT
jgi:hypothetical protein